MQGAQFTFDSMPHAENTNRGPQFAVGGDSVSVLHVGDGGTLSTVRETHAENDIISVAISPSGNSLIAGSFFSTLVPFAVDASTGTLTPGTTQLVHWSPEFMVVEPSGTFLYAGQGEQGSAISVVRIGSNGSLSVNQDIAAGTHTSGLAIVRAR